MCARSRLSVLALRAAADPGRSTRFATLSALSIRAMSRSYVVWSGRNRTELTKPNALGIWIWTGSPQHR